MLFAVAAAWADESPAVALARLKAETDVLDRFLKAAQTATRPGSSGATLIAELSKAEPALRDAAVRGVQEGIQATAEALKSQAESLHRENDALVTARNSVLTALDERQKAAWEVRQQGQIAETLASLLSVDKKWFWLCGVFAIASLLGVVWHDRRRELRRRLNVGMARTLGLSYLLSFALAGMVVLTAVLFLSGDWIYQWLLSEVATSEPPKPTAEAASPEMQKEIDVLRSRRDKLDQQLQQTASLAETAWNAQGSAAGLATGWIEFNKQALACAVEAAFRENLLPLVRADARALEDADRELGSQRSEIADRLQQQRTIRLGLGAGLIGLVFLGGVWFYRASKRRIDRWERTCPLCLGEGFLQVRRADETGESRMVVCRNIVREMPQEECGYRFPAAFRELPKLCFPTLGVPQAGKTHWLAMLYWALNHGYHPKSVQFEKLKLQTSTELDRLVEDILRTRLGTAATQRDRIPHPVVFQFRDQDFWGRANLLVNIFDYSGEVTVDMKIEDYRRRRALDADGYFFFLDPTYPAAPQAQALLDFRDDVRRMRGLSPNARLKTPVAICVSKIDLLSNQAGRLPGGAEAIEHFYAELGRIDPTGEAFNVKVIEARSRLMSELRKTLWPEWDIERQVRELFGSRFLFFPLTPVGLEGSGETDLSLRTIAPFGLLEPLFWLLRMNGYCILK